MRRTASIIFALILAATAAAQTTDSKVNGTVKDETGAVVAGATVRLLDDATKAEVTAVANDEGAYFFANVRPGTYTVTAEQAGFKKSSVERVKVDVGVPATVNFTLTSQNAGPGDGLGVAQVKLVTPRGSSEYHGSVFEYHRNAALDANTFFNNANGIEKPQLIRNQFGFLPETEVEFIVDGDDVRIDAMFVVPRRWPKHLPNVWLG